MWGHRLQGPIVFIGDIHGRFTLLSNLWSKLRNRVGGKTFEKLNIVFLGDYCDRGGETKEVVEWLTKLPERHPQQEHLYLCGNHDLALSAFMGLQPFSGLDFTVTRKTFKPKHVSGQKDEKWYSGVGADTMHLQGLRWACTKDAESSLGKGSPYDSGATFDSYGVRYGDREGLIKAMPQHHKQFFSNLEWVAELQSSIGNIIAVHAGFEEKDVLSQIQKLKDKWPWNPWLEPICGRQNVETMPSILREPILQRPGIQPAPQFLVSGHHGFLRITGRRLIIDSEGEQINSVLMNTQPIPHGHRGNQENLRRYGALHMEVITS